MSVDFETGFDEEGDELAVRRAVGRSQQGIWSGRHHKASVGLEHSEDEEDENDGEIDDAQEGSEDDEYDDWDVEEGLENLSQAGLSALDCIGEDFERNAARNSGFSYFEFNTM